MAENGTDWSNRSGYIVLAVLPVFMVPYGLCVVVMLREEYRRFAGYKIMLAMGVVDFFQICHQFIMGSVLTIIGVPIFGSNDTLTENYFWLKRHGAVIMGTWIMYSTLNLVLAVNRLIELSSSSYAARLFGGKRTYGWILGALVYSLGIVIFYSTPYATVVLHTGLGMWAVDLGGELYGLTISSVWNYCLCISLPILYVFIVRTFLRMTNDINDSDEIAAKERSVVLQSLFVSIMTVTATLCYTFAAEVMPAIVSLTCFEIHYPYNII